MFITTENLFAEKSDIDKTDLEKKIEERKKTRGIEDTDKIHYESEPTDKSKQAQEQLKAVTGHYTPEEVRHLLKTDIESLQRKIDDLESALKNKRLKNKEKKLIKKEISETQYKLSEAKSKLHEAKKKMAEAVKGTYPSMSSSIAKHSVTFSRGGAEGSMSWKILQKQKSEAKLILEDLQKCKK